ncbi:ABC transporter ATP-binding protein [Alkaliphilus sp. B6464]|uniref:ABC transporter ATP-binding protein n=1 Tax=Alkaliphilus sp. B6464 TaxID=2731219 RepID=UPI001BAE4F25|nr:ABC transporter ATP-binding protein [Alkaliphilus sp. B6464]QUH19121.1 ABC transporter ATP-binding protein [Alkaliphilus sp. B6464]
MIEVKEIRKNFKKVEAVKGVSLTINDGEILGLLGPNGAGKSTTISIISTLFPPSSGEVLYKGKDILKNPKGFREILGAVPQEIALYPELTGYENLRFFGKVYGLKGKELEQRIQEVLEIVGLNGRVRDLVKSYSGGMKRRVNIGCALLHKPKILIMDEPTVGIDPQSRNHILETVKRLREEGMTIIYTSHYMEEVEYLCDRIYIMDHGEIIATGSKEELKEQISNEETMEVIFETIQDDTIEVLKNIVGVKAVNSNDNMITLIYEKGINILQLVFEKAQDRQEKIISIQIKTPTLEDVFLKLTGRTIRD